MKKLALVLFSCGVLFAQDFHRIKLLDGLNQLERSLEMAKRSEVDNKEPYHFEKARASLQVATILASHMDEAGSRLFMVKSFGFLSKAMAGKSEPDSLELIGREKSSEWIDLQSLNSKLSYVRENKGLMCAPAELARAEVYYEALAYELSKPKPSRTNLMDFYSRAFKEINDAEQKVNIAKEGGLECYTGKPFVPEVVKVESEQRQIAQAGPQGAGEPLMVVARVHFDFNKYSIKKEYIPVLNEVVKVLRENPDVRVRIEGFTDDIGSKAYNDRLALRRAQEVKKYLVRAGIPEERIEVAGFGKERYIADNRTPIGRFTNRRAEFIVIQVPGQ